MIEFSALKELCGARFPGLCWRGRHIVTVQDDGGWKAFVMLAFVVVFAVFISLMF